MTHATVSDAGAVVVRDTDYVLDGVGNRSTVAGAPDAGPHVGTYRMDPTLPDPADFQVNQYTTIPPETRSYDPNGNLTIIDNSLPTQRDIEYDYLNQIVEYVVIATGERHTYAYDALRRRIAKVVDADGVAGGPDETRFFYHGARVIEEQRRAGGAQATYVYGPDGMLNMRRGEVDYYYHRNLYNVMAVTDAAGNVVERHEYQDYGQPLDPNTLAAIAGDPSAIGNPYLAAGRRYESETGWYQSGGTYFDPIAARVTRSGGPARSHGYPIFINGFSYELGIPYHIGLSAIRNQLKISIPGNDPDSTTPLQRFTLTNTTNAIKPAPPTVLVDESVLFIPLIGQTPATQLLVDQSALFIPLFDATLLLVKRRYQSTDDNQFDTIELQQPLNQLQQPLHPLPPPPATVLVDQDALFIPIFRYPNGFLNPNAFNSLMES